MSESIQLTCQTCVQTLEVESGTAERVIDCPHCGNPLRIPDPEELREMEERAEHQAQQQQVVLTRGRRLALRVGCLVVGVNLLFAVSLQALPRPEAVGQNYLRMVQERRAGIQARYGLDEYRSRANAEREAADDRQSEGWAASVYQKALLTQLALAGGFVLVGAGLLGLLIAARSKAARILLGLLCLAVPVLAAVSCVLLELVLPRYLDTTSAALFIGASAVRLIVCFAGAYVLFRSASVIAYTAKPDKAKSRSAVRVAA